MRVVFTVGVHVAAQCPWLKLIGSLLLFWIAIKLLVEDGEEKDIKDSSNIWGAVRTIAIADLVMSLDNVLAIAAAAKGNWSLIIIGLATSIPLIVFGATLVMWLLDEDAGAGLGGCRVARLDCGRIDHHGSGCSSPSSSALARQLGISFHALERIAAAAIGAGVCDPDGLA